METSLLCFCMRWGACADPGIFVPENSSDNFLVLNFTEGDQWLFQTKLYMYIFFLFLFFFFFFFGGGGPNANFYRNPYSL